VPRRGPSGRLIPPNACAGNSRACTSRRGARPSDLHLGSRVVLRVRSIAGPGETIGGWHCHLPTVTA